MALMRGDDMPQMQPQQQPHQPVYLPEDEPSTLSLIIRRCKKFAKWFGVVWIIIFLLWLGLYFMQDSNDISILQGLFYCVSHYVSILIIGFIMIAAGSFWIKD